MLKNVAEAHRRLIRRRDIEHQRKLNYNYIIENRDYLLDTFPALWVMVANQSCGQSNESLDYLMKSLRNQDLTSPSNLYVYCDMYHFNIMTEMGEHDV